MKLYLMRHARAYHNDAGLADEDPTDNVHLNDKGKEQASKVALELQTVPFDGLFVSELFRTQETAAAINEYHHLPMIIDKRLNDIVTGFHRQPWQKVVDFRKNSSDMYTAKLPGKESIADVRDRVASFISDLKESDHTCVLVVTHGDPAVCFKANIENLPLDEAFSSRITNTEYWIFEL